MALGVVAATLWLGARVLNQALDNDPHWDKPFGVVIGDRQYTVRSLPGDMYHAFTDPRNYALFRTSPGFQFGMSLLFKRDSRGQPVDWTQMVKDMLTPMPLTRREGTRMGDNIASALGITPMPFRYETEINRKVSEWEKNNKDPKIRELKTRREEEVTLPSMYLPMRDALRDGNLKAAQDEYSKILQKGWKKDDVEKAMKKWVNSPLTGSRKKEEAFKKTLSGPDRELYAKAMKERKFIYGQFRALLRGATYQVYPQHLER